MTLIPKVIKIMSNKITKNQAIDKTRLNFMLLLKFTEHRTNVDHSND